MHDQKTLEWFDRMGKPRPTSDIHGTDDDVRSKLKMLECRNWRLEGNLLKCDTNMGPLVQSIPTSYICRGTGPDGLPILEKL